MSIFTKIKLQKCRTLEGYIDWFAKDKVNYSEMLPTDDMSAYKEADADTFFRHIKMYDQLSEIYNLNSIADCNNDFDNAIKLMNWLTDNTYYSGQQLAFHRQLPDNAVDILKFSFGKSFRYAINCRYKAIAFSDILNSVGIKSYPVCLEPEHLICQAYIKEQNKWIALDPSFNSYFTDEDNCPLSIFEVRDGFLQNKSPNIVGYNFNGTDECKEVYINNFIRTNLHCIITWKDNSEENRYSPTFEGRKDFSFRIPLKYQ